MSKTIDNNAHYSIRDEQFYCCGETQFRHVCKKHQTRMGCMFCEFDPYAACDC